MSDDTTQPLMRAVVQHELGGPEVLHVEQVPRPRPRMSEILVRVHAAGLNPTDYNFRRSSRMLGMPFTLGWDVAGVVEAVGRGVTLFQPGDEVCGMLPYPRGAGAYADYVAGPTRAFVRRPDNLDFVYAGALPLAGLTAWQALVDTAGISAGDRVLVESAAGGVGHLAVQIAKQRGAYVVGTASAAKHDYLREIGVDEPIDYHGVNLGDVVGDLDVVLDTVGGEHRFETLRTLRRGGTLVSLHPVPTEGLDAAAADAGVRLALMTVEADHEGMRRVADLAGSGAIRVDVAETFPLEDAARAHALGEQGHVTGKLVLTTGA